MGLAISLRSDHPSAEAVKALWREVERFEERPSMELLGYPPHVTLAMYDDEAVREADARQALARACRNLDAVTLVFDAIRSFEGAQTVLWAAPRPSETLQAVHAAIHAAIDPAFCRPYYRPGAWVPHCTLGTMIGDEQREAALAFAAGFEKAISVTFDGLDCISFPALAPVELRRLK